jgi:hypothetical protein
MRTSNVSYHTTESGERHAVTYVRDVPWCPVCEKTISEDKPQQDS